MIKTLDMVAPQQKVNVLLDTQIINESFDIGRNKNRRYEKQNMWK